MLLLPSTSLAELGRAVPFVILEFNTDVVSFQVPDVSALWWVPWISKLQAVEFVASVGFSATIFASTSVVALLTIERVAAGKPRLGFLNPILYAHPGAFNDMKTGKA
jgi:hypothetical protein